MGSKIKKVGLYSLTVLGIVTIFGLILIGWHKKEGY